MSSGSKPWDPLYLSEIFCPVDRCLLEVVSPFEVPANFAVASMSVPLIWDITFSTGPPGAAWIIRKLTSIIPSSVGIIKNRRLIIYVII